MSDGLGSRALLTLWGRQWLAVDWYGLWLLWVLLPAVNRVPLARVRDHARVVRMRERAKVTAKARAEAALGLKHRTSRHRHRDPYASPPLPLCSQGQSAISV